MSTNKVMIKERVLSTGGGARRVILDYEAGLIYPYQAPERIVGVFEPGKGWVILSAPYYSSGGWGRPGTGDADGYYSIDNAKKLVKAIKGKLFEVNLKEFMSQSELDAMNAEIKKHNEVLESRKRIAEQYGRNYNGRDEVVALESVKIEQSDSWYHGRTDGITPKGMDPIKAVELYSKAAETFTLQKRGTVKCGDYVITKDLVKQGSRTVAFRDAAGKVFMNSQMLEVSHFEREFMGGQSLIQKTLRECASVSIPFNVLESAQLSLSKTKILEQGPEEDFELYEGTRHFTGALLLENSGRKFLMDVDRIEIKHKLFNVFFVEVNAAVKSIAEAYESMKPQEVKDAEAQGIEVKRQGEWFFIATDKTVTVMNHDVKQWEPMRGDEGQKLIVRQSVSHGKGRPNNLFKPWGFEPEINELVCGIVTHTGREHAPLDLGQKTKQIESKATNQYEQPKAEITFRLWKLVPNTTIGNFTIRGDVD